MKLTKQIEAEVLDVYEAYWGGLLNVDLETYAAVLDKDFKLIGTTEAEVFFKRLEAIRFLKNTADQVAGNIELRNRIIKIEPVDELVLITEQCDAYVSIDNVWAFYAKTRTSSLLQKKDSSWKFIQMHISFPDSKSDEGESIGLEKISKENLELKEAIKRRTIELEEKNRELEIDTSLERVRAIALGMTRPQEMLDICYTISNELKQLGIKEIRNIQTAVFYTEKGTYMNYEYYIKHDKSVITEVDYCNKKVHKDQRQFAKKMLSGDGAFYTRSFKGQQLKAWYNYQKGTEQLADRYLLKANSLNYYMFSLGFVTLGISTYYPLSKQELELFKRFRNVFKLAYRRFLDIEKAEAQAREAQIELALERVRARSLAMYNTSELQDVIHTVHKELLNLNIAINGGSFIAINNDIDNTLHCWGSGGTADTSEEVHLPLYQKPFCTNILKRIKNGPSFFTEEYSQKEKNEFFTFLFKHEPWSKLDAKQKKETLSSKGGYTRSCCVSTYTSIFIINHFGEKFSPADNDILQRFGKVFEQTYTRFLDLQKAETQAKEAAIELGLERVRARAMAMHKSDELAELVDTVFQELTKLGFALDRFLIMLFNETNNSSEWWVSNAPAGLLVEYHQHKPYLEYIKNWKSRTPGWQYFLAGEEKKEWDNYIFENTELSLLPTPVKNGMRSVQEVYLNAAFHSFGSLTFSTFEPISDNEFDLLLRFTKVFDQTYTRFLDLLKAEAQAKEAQIEASLERVRSRSMAMHKSDELLEAGEILFLEMQKLGIESLTAGYVLIDKEEKNGLNYTPHPGTKKIMPVPVIIPHNETIHMQAVVDNWKNGKPFFIVEMNEEETIKHQTFIAERSTNFPLTAAQLIAISPARLFLHNFYFKEGYILIVGGTKLSAEQTDIMLRFAKVFQQTYTRFLDLQKAEAQAREAQIEAALERVRSRTMAMQRSDELLDVASILFQQVKALGVPQWNCGFNIWNTGDKEFTYYPGTPDGVISPSPCKIPLTKHPVFKRFDESRKKGEELLIYEKQGEEQEDHYRYMLSLPGVGDLLRSMLDAGFTLPTFQIDHVANFAYGNLIFITFEHFPQMHDVFKRFAKVFEQTYTRFLDLQKAEAQAREAQIEAALERVRSQSMGMQTSKDLSNVTTAMFEQLRMLGGELYATGIVFCDKHEHHVEQWHSVPGAGMLSPFIVPVDLDYIHQYRYDQWEKGVELFSVEIPEDFIALHFEAMFNLPTVKAVLDDFAEKNIPMPETPRWEIDYGASFSQGYILVSALQPFNSATILPRFAKVFEQTYTRFLDLQKAEAQAREAKIEAALEKARSRSMAMQSSDELPEVANVLFLEIQALGIPAWSCGYNIFAEDKTSATCWMSSEGTLQKPFKLRLFGEASFAEMGDFIRSKKEMLVQELGDKALEEHYAYMKSFPDLKPTFDQLDELGLSLPTYQINHLCKFTQGFLLFITYERVPEAHDIFKRFTKVFEQTYTRFLDLKKAEAQTREAQINLAVERVRARALAMFKSEEILELVFKLKQEMMNLDIPNVVAATIHLKDKDGNFTMWDLTAMEYDDGKLHQPMVVHYRLEEVDSNLFIKRMWDSTASYSVVVQDEEDLKRTIQFLRDHERTKEADESEAFLKSTSIKFGYHPTIPLHNGRMCIDLLEPPSDEVEFILTKMGAAFDLAYKRFEDLKNSEVQLKEAQIEAALEKVRSRTMAMQSSNELQETAAVLFNEFKKLGSEDIYQVTIGIYNEVEALIDFRVTSWAGSGVQENRSFKLDMNEPTVLAPSVSAWKANKKSLVIDLTDEALEGWLNYRNKMSGITVSSADTAGRRVISIAYYSKGHLSISTPLPVPAGTLNTLERFAAVFDATYTRFLDLQKAEEQAREAQVELALERVRARTMAMQQSIELREIVATIYEQLQNLGFRYGACGIVIMDEVSGDMNWWMAGFEKKDYPENYNIPYFNHPFYIKQLSNWRQGKPYVVIETAGEEKKSYDEYMFNHTDFSKIEPEAKKIMIAFEKITFSNANMKHGALSWGPMPIDDELGKILKRFAKVFEQTYTRFLDLQKAEEQARQAKIETALEKVRARALAMQHPEELIEVAKVLRHEMGLLSVEELETCSIYIHDETINRIECWYALKDIRSEEKKLVSDHFSLNLSDTWVGREMEEFYRSNAKQVSILMQGAHRKEWINYCEEKSIPFRGYYGKVIPDRTYHLYKFSHGAIGAASLENISAESWDLLKRAASVFSLAYSRFKDLTQARVDLLRLKEEKQRAETALSDLQSTQKQLIQSEKMASLGELTAGIAHEIQNPLNFVNNFSEVSKELLDEMKEAIEKGDTEEAKEIMNDVIQNLEKINHHGKRADGIVKGMLQHSRSSNGVKEPTDINALADEYLRLAYHGLRAKDKSFNATIKTEYDETIGNINIIPQDIGRVILNLITNAFYAAPLPPERGFSDPDYVHNPTVWVSTKKEGNKILISVRDNGPGIPQKVLDKIFQPFFTTKPTGQGTGLGLSLSYDIVKAHRGEIKVNTMENEGTEFTISLPA